MDKEMHRFVVWGLGRNGKILYEIFGKEKIVAYIDSNPIYAGKNHEGIPVIDLAQYKEQFGEFPIIISAIAYEEEIAEVLVENGIDTFFRYSEDIEKVRTFFLQVDKTKLLAEYIDKEICLYEDTLFGLLVADYLEKIGHSFSFIVKNRASAFYTEMNSPHYCYHPELQKFKNYHKGERCFIVATGPSLKISDLDVLKKYGEICFSVNGIFKCFGQTDWRPDYYVVSDPSATLQWSKDIWSMNVKQKFVADVAYFYKDEPVEQNIYKWHIQVEWGDERLPQFTEDFSRISYCGDTITYDGALQLAAYMGFKEIYLLGTDCCQYESGKQHFVDNYQAEGFTDAQIHVDKQLLAYESAYKYSKTHGFKIYNATRGGKLDVFERVEFDTLFGN